MIKVQNTSNKQQELARKKAIAETKKDMLKGTFLPQNSFYGSMSDDDSMSKKTIEVYYTSTLKSDDFKHVYRTKYFHRDYADLRHQGHVRFERNLDLATHNLKNECLHETPSLNGYIYTANVKIENNYLDEDDKIPEFYAQRLLQLLTLENPTSSISPIKSAINQVSFRVIKGNLNGLLGAERTVSLLKKIGIKGCYSATHFTFFSEKDCPSVTPRQEIKAVSICQKSAFFEGLKTSPTTLLSRILTPNTMCFDHGYIQALSDGNDDFKARLYTTIKEEYPNFKFDTYETIISKKISKCFNQFSEFTKTSKKAPQPTLFPLPKTLTELAKYQKSMISLEGATHSAHKCTDTETKQVIVTKTTANTAACKVEFEAYQIYKAFGVKTPDVELIEEDGKSIMVLEYIEGPMLHTLLVNNEYNIFNDAILEQSRKEICKDFVIDALIGNFDNIKHHYGNMILSSKTNEIYRIDPGASLNFDFSGALKSSDDSTYKWDTKINDFFTFRTHSYHAQNTFGGMSNTEILAGLEKAISYMPAVQKAASPENYTIIAQRLLNASEHFSRLCALENHFAENMLDITQEPKKAFTEPPQKTTSNLHKFKTLKIP